MIVASDLGSCPHCGGVAVVVGRIATNRKSMTYHAVCSKCGTRTRLCSSSRTAEMIWDRRIDAGKALERIASGRIRNPEAFARYVCDGISVIDAEKMAAMS